ncbi:mCG10770 [Mus musculus]|nr:mCG10770 [Mus musculus]
MVRRRGQATGDGHVWWFERECPSQAHWVNTWSPVGGAVYGTFGSWIPAGRSPSVEAFVTFSSLSVPPLCFPCADEICSASLPLLLPCHYECPLWNHKPK